MGSGSSCLTASVAPLSPSSIDEDADQGLLEKLAGQPALLSKPVPGLSLLLGGVAQTWVHVACERKQVQVVQRMFEFLTGSSVATVREAVGPYCRRMGLPLPATPSEGLRIAVGMCNGKGQTPLMHACYAGCPELVKYLLEQGANPWVVDRCGCRMALHYAAIAGCAGCVAALMRSAMSQQVSRDGSRYIDACSLSGLTPLHYAVYYERHNVLRELLRHDPDINAQTSSCSYDVWLDCDSCSTPLHFAAVRGNATAVQELLRYYAARRHTGQVVDPRMARNACRKQPWHLAASQYPALRFLAVVLHPGQPLTRVLGGDEGSQVASLGVPTLAAIAAAALRQKLLATVALAEAEAQEAERKGATKAAAAAGTAACTATAAKALSIRAIRQAAGSRCGSSGGNSGSSSRALRKLASSGLASSSSGGGGGGRAAALATIRCDQDRSSPHALSVGSLRAERLLGNSLNSMGGSGPSSGLSSASASGGVSRSHQSCRSLADHAQGRHPFGVHDADFEPGLPTATYGTLTRREVDSSAGCFRPGTTPSRMCRRRAHSAAVRAITPPNAAAGGGGGGVSGANRCGYTVHGYYQHHPHQQQQQPLQAVVPERKDSLLQMQADPPGGEEDEAGNVCNVCFVRQEAVVPYSCQHGLCATCARELSYGVTAKPLLCPFCRRPVTEFVRLAKQQQQLVEQQLAKQQLAKQQSQQRPSWGVA